MTIAPSAPSGIASLCKPDLAGDSAPSESTDILFEALLKGFDKVLKFEDEGQLAIYPEIGQSAGSFLEAALPAGTALPFAPIVERVQDVIGQVQGAIEASHPAPLAEQASCLLVTIAEALGTWAPSPWGSPSASNSSALVVAPALPAHAAGPSAVPSSSSPLPMPRIRHAAWPGGAKGLPASLRLPGGPNMDRPAASATSHFAAHLFDLDGQLRLVVKLPKLPDDQRMELERRLHELLEEFGYLQSELVLREAGRAAHG